MIAVLVFAPMILVRGGNQPRWSALPMLVAQIAVLIDFASLGCFGEANEEIGRISS
jgi:hypothetical protein